MAKRTSSAKKKAPKASSKKTKAPSKKAKASTKKKVVKKKTVKKKKSASSEELTIDRRREERRDEEADFSVAKPKPAAKLKPRAKVNRRRQIDPTTCERDYSVQEVEFMNAMDDYKRTSGRMFPTCSEVLEVIRGLGYIQLSEAERTARQATVAPLTDSADSSTVGEDAFSSGLDTDNSFDEESSELVSMGSGDNEDF